MKKKKFLNAMIAAFFCCTIPFLAASCDLLTPSLKCSPNKVEVAAGATATVTVKGGTTPYTVSAKDATIATATLDKTTITIKGEKAGSTTVTVTDKNKKTCTVNVTVKAAK